MHVGCENIWTTKVEAQILDLLNENGLWIRDMGCDTISTTKIKAQICDLLNKVAFVYVWVVKLYEPLRLKHKTSDLLSENRLQIRNMGCETIWTTKVEAQNKWFVEWMDN